MGLKSSFTKATLVRLLPKLTEIIYAVETIGSAMVKRHSEKRASLPISYADKREDLRLSVDSYKSRILSSRVFVLDSVTLRNQETGLGRRNSAAGRGCMPRTPHFAPSN